MCYVSSSLREERTYPLLTEIPESENPETINISPLRGLPDSTSVRHSPRQRHNLLRGILHAARYGEVQSRFANHALAFFDVGSFQTNHDRNFHAEVGRRVDHAARDHIAAHDAAENVDEHRAHVLVGEQDAEGRFDAFL